MIKVILNIIILLQAVTCKSLAESEAKAGFSVACQGPRSIGQMTKTAEIVTEAVVVDVSPARDNVYAVTLQVLQIFKGKPQDGEQAVGPFVQLLFLKPKTKKRSRSVDEPRKYLEACIYAMDLKKGKKYNLFLASQPGTMASKKGKMARFFMTAPPVLASKKSTRKILAVTCPTCGKKPVVKSVDMTLVNNSDKVKLVCRIKDFSRETEIYWKKDGQPVIEIQGKIKIRSRRSKSVLTVAHVSSDDSGSYTCIAKNVRGEDEKSAKVTVQEKSTTTTTPSTTSTTTTTTTVRPNPVRRILFPKLPGESSSCPITGYCLNGGECSFIPWLGEMSCSCAPGYQGARCERKTTSALYSASFNRSNTLCLFGIVNPYHSCK